MLREAEGADGLLIQEVRETTSTALYKQGAGQNSVPRWAQGPAWLWYTWSVTSRRHGATPSAPLLAALQSHLEFTKRWQRASAPESAASRNAALLTDSESGSTPTSRPCRGACDYSRGVNRDVKGRNRRFCGQPHSILWRSFRAVVFKGEPGGLGGREVGATSLPAAAIVRLDGAGVNGAEPCATIREPSRRGILAIWLLDSYEPTA